jgi:hypothetical protein
VTTPQLPGQVIGTPGGSLGAGHNDWAANEDVARVGRSGEVTTSRVLHALAHRPGGPTVFHDLKLPHSDSNIDHLVVSGNRVTIVDSKAWAAGTYINVFGRVFRSSRRFAFGDHGRLGWIAIKLAAHLPAGCTIAKPVLVVWPSSNNKATNVNLLRWRDTRVVHGSQLTQHRAARLFGDKRADPAIVAHLLRLVAKPSFVQPSAPAVPHSPDDELPPMDLLT